MELRALAGSQVTAYSSFDLDPKNYYTMYDNISEDSWKPGPQDTLDDTLTNIDTEAATKAAALMKRDSAMLGPTLDPEISMVTAGNFEREMEQIFAKHPELLDQDEVRVVAPYGSGHAMLYHRAQAAGVTVEWSESHTPSLLRYNAELVLSRAIGTTPPQEALINAFKESAINDGLFDNDFMAVEKISMSFSTWYIRSRTAHLDEQDVLRLHESLRQNTDPIRQTIDGLLTAKGLEPLARTTTEMWDYYERSGEAGSWSRPPAPLPVDTKPAVV
jgi:hypothetical protein